MFLFIYLQPLKVTDSVILLSWSRPPALRAEVTNFLIQMDYNIDPPIFEPVYDGM